MILEVEAVHDVLFTGEFATVEKIVRQIQPCFVLGIILYSPAQLLFFSLKIGQDEINALHFLKKLGSSRMYTISDVLEQPKVWILFFQMLEEILTMDCFLFSQDFCSVLLKKILCFIHFLALTISLNVWLSSSVLQNF